MALIHLSIYGISCLVVYRLLKLAYKEYTSPNRYLPGPARTSLVYGNLNEIFAAENSVMHEKWVEEYGPTIRYYGFLGMTRFYTTDVKAIHHIMMNHYDFQKPDAMRQVLVEIFGDGLLNTEEDRHKFQRRVMNPAFGPAQVRQLTTIFVDKALQLRDAWKSQIDLATNSEAKADGTARLDVLSWLSKMTLDVIGLAGFNYEFNALQAADNELNKAFTIIFTQGSRPRIWQSLRIQFPILRSFPDFVSSTIRDARGTMDRIGRELLVNAKRGLLSEKDNNSESAGKDLLTLLVKSNMNEKQGQQMSDEDVVAQVPTFLIAGHETSSTATTWTLFALTQLPDIQRKLREELLGVSTDTPTMDELNSLPYLDAVVRETLRLHAPVPTTTRMAVRDTVLPLNEPVDGKDYVEIRKGQTIFISILALNRSRKLWGEDAAEFKPERWLNGSIDTSLPGVWGNMMTFLGGARSCIGYRFALVEIKALLFTLVRAFEFELAVPVEDLGKKSSIVQRPFVRSEEKKGSQLPLIVKLYNPEQ
ncbi:cytochrome P450 [Marasmius fiardii PR-910]|nr:cytochrome P450 [Marasmius fiardii PR-910]